MGPQTKDIGGGSATGLADNYVSQLQQLLNGGGMGPAGAPNATGSTGNIMAVLTDLLSSGGGKAGGAISQLLGKQQERDVNGLRARFGVGGGTAFGTPAAYAESNYRAEAAPQITQAITGLQLSAIMPLLQQIGGLSGKGIPQRQTVQQRSGFGEFINTLGQLAPTAASFFTPGFGKTPGTGNTAVNNSYDPSAWEDWQ